MSETEPVVVVIGDIEADPRVGDLMDRLNTIGITPGVHGSKMDMLWYEDFNFCGCGSRENTQTWMQAVLTTMKSDPWSGHEARESALQSDPEAMKLFVLYVLDAMGLTEHGGSVYGSWLTDYGKTVLDALEADRSRREAIR